MTNIVTDINEWKDIRKNLANTSIGFIATMGSLHLGHMSLCRRSKKENDVSVVSIFINPTQFNQACDFELYPRTLEQDKAQLIAHEIDYLFCPNVEEMYPDNYQVKVYETHLSKMLEGEFRPGHFDGMMTIVLKLFNLVQPTRAYFGEKDYQQLLLIQKMVAAYFLPLEIIACETMRDKDGLALSSRNSRLTTMQRQKAIHFSRLLQSSLSCEKITEQLHALGFKVEYIVDQWQRRLGAVWLDDVRLIDNVIKLS